MANQRLCESIWRCFTHSICSHHPPSEWAPCRGDFRLGILGCKPTWATLRHGRVTTWTGRNVLGAVASETHAKFSLFTRGLILPGLSHVFVHLFPLYLFSIMFRSPDLPEALPSRMGMLRAPPHHVPGILGQFGTARDGLGRLGTAWKAWDGFGKSVGPCTSKWKTLKTVQGTRCYCSVRNCGWFHWASTNWTGMNRNHQQTCDKSICYTGVFWMLCTVWTVPSSQVKCRTCPGRNWNWKPLNSKAVSLTLESQHGTSFTAWNFWVSAFHILVYLLILAQFILHSVSISLQHRNFAVEYGKQKLIYISIAWILWLPRGNPWSGKTPKASELFLVAIPQSSCQAESGNKIMVSKHHPCPGDPMTVQMKLKLKSIQKPQKASKSLKSPKSSQLQRKSSQSVLEFHEKMRGFTDHARGGSIASGFGTWGSASAPGSSGAKQCRQPNLFLISKMSTSELLAKQGQRETSTHVNATSMCDSFPEFNHLAPLEKQLWVKFLLRNARREHRELDLPKRTKNVWCHFCIQCLHPFTLPLNLPHLRNIELSWIILDYW